MTKPEESLGPMMFVMMGDFLLVFVADRKPKLRNSN
jgi:hypothetical protein